MTCPGARASGEGKRARAWGGGEGPRLERSRLSSPGRGRGVRPPPGPRGALSSGVRGAGAGAAGGELGSAKLRGELSASGRELCIRPDSFFPPEPGR